MNKQKEIAHITEKEKDSPAYRKKIEEENENLKNSLESVQNQSTSVLEANASLTKENIVLKERMRGLGVDHVLEVLYTLLLGAALTLFIDKNFYSAAAILLADGAIYLIQLLIRAAFTKR